MKYYIRFDVSAAFEHSKWETVEVTKEEFELAKWYNEVLLNKTVLGLPSEKEDISWTDEQEDNYHSLMEEIEDRPRVKGVRKGKNTYDIGW